jgi:hypothetical protein
VRKLARVLSVIFPLCQVLKCLHVLVDKDGDRGEGAGVQVSVWSEEGVRKVDAMVIWRIWHLDVMA